MFSDKDIPERYFLKVMLTPQTSTNPNVQKRPISGIVNISTGFDQEFFVQKTELKTVKNDTIH